MRCRRELLAGLWVASMLHVFGQVELGSDVLTESGFQALQGKRVGLLTNPSGVNRRLESTIDLLWKAKGVRLKALFAPEHGLNGEYPAGKEFTNRVDSRTGLVVYSLYGLGIIRKPTPEMLKQIDALVYDVQDTGCRSYTFISTMGLAMEACAEAGVEFIVLDRPNPVGGEMVEGPILDLRYRSLIGQWKIPYLYGMTCGELARMINGEGWIRKSCRLQVIPMKGWRRSMSWKDTGLFWIATSPHIPYGQSPLYYPSTGILGWVGGVNIGVRYTLPFQCIAAPWLDSQKLSQTLNSYHLAGVRFHPVTYTPFDGAFKDKTVSGAQIFFTEPARAPKMAINFYALEAIKKIAGRDLFAAAMKEGRNTAEFDKIAGNAITRQQLAAGTSAAAIVHSWRAGEDLFRQQRKKYLLY